MSDPVRRNPVELTEKQERVLDFIEAAHILIQLGMTVDDLVEVIRAACPAPVVIVHHPGPIPEA
ncbi:MAG: hypothetical protein AAFV53_21055 [Myxococcota bacterium]